MMEIEVYQDDITREAFAEYRRSARVPGTSETPDSFAKNLVINQIIDDVVKHLIEGKSALAGSLTAQSTKSPRHHWIGDTIRAVPSSKMKRNEIILFAHPGTIHRLYNAGFPLKLELSW